MAVPSRSQVQMRVHSDAGPVTAPKDEERLTVTALHKSREVKKQRFNGTGNKLFDVLDTELSIYQLNHYMRDVQHAYDSYSRCLKTLFHHCLDSAECTVVIVDC